MSRTGEVKNGSTSNIKLIMSAFILMFALIIVITSVSSDICDADTITVDDNEYNIISEENLTVELCELDCNAKGATTIPSTVTYDDVVYTVVRIGNNACEGTDITSVSLPDTITSIGNYAFKNCYNLGSIDFSDALTTIGDEAFKGCSSIVTLAMPKLTKMGKDSFSGCYGLINVSMNSLEKVTSGAFSGCDSLLKVNMNSLKIIGDNAFSGCTSLMTFGGDEKVLCLPNVTTIGESAFENCSEFESIKFGVYLTTIEKNAFRNVLLGSIPDAQVILPNSLITIGEGAFSSTDGIGSYNVVSIPSSVTYIGKEAFSARGNLTIYFNGNVDQSAATSIKMGEKAFYASGKIYIYMWNECTDLDLSKYVQGKTTIEKHGENHAQVTMRCNDGYRCSYESAVLLNNGYLILPYGELSMTEMGKDPKTLYFGVSASSQASATLALLNTKGDHDSIAKSGDYFRPVVTYTMSDDVRLYYIGSIKQTDAGGGITIDADFESGITKADVTNWQFETKTYWYRDEVVLPTFGGTLYTKDTVYGKDSKVNINGEHAVYYPDADSITLGYIESMLLVTVAKFPTLVYWVDAVGTTVTYEYFGDTVEELPEAADKTAYHFLWWSTVDGSYDEKDMVVAGETKINTVETYYYAIYEANTYYVKVYCTTPVDIAGYVVDTKTGEEYFTMAGYFTFYIDGKSGQIYYMDKDHTTYTLMFDATTWQEGYIFSSYVYKTLQVEDKTYEAYNTDLEDQTEFVVEMEMIERTYSMKLKFLDELGYALNNEYVEIEEFYGTKTKSYYEVDTDTMTVKDILYRDLKESVILAVPLYNNSEDRYTYNNTAKNETYGDSKIKTDADNNLYVNYESFKKTGGERTDEITVAYYFSPGMFNIKYLYDDDQDSAYRSPTTVSEGDRVKIINADSKVKTGYQFTKWVVLDSDGNIPAEAIYYTAGSIMSISDVTKYADSANTIMLKGIWEPKTVTITFSLQYGELDDPVPITMKVNDTATLPDGSSYNRSGWVMFGWMFVVDGETYNTLTLTPTLYGAYVQEYETIPMYANWVIKSYTFEVKHYDESDPETEGCPSMTRYTTKISCLYKSTPIELWKADAIDASQQFKTLMGWIIKYTEKNDEGNVTFEDSITIPLGTYNIDELTWCRLAEIAKRQGSDTFECLQDWDEKTFQFYFTTDGGGTLEQNTMGPFKIDDEFNVYSGDTLNKRGYTFTGWYCGTDTITIYTPSLDPDVYKYQFTSTMSSMAVDGTLTFTAAWSPVTYSINYDLDGGLSTDPLPRTAYYDTHLEINYPTKSGYEFKGWTATDITSGAQYKSDDKWSSWDGKTILTKNLRYLSWTDSSTVTLTAIWGNIGYSIEYDLNGGNGTILGGTTVAKINDKFTLPTLLNAEKTGYVFIGWSYDKTNIYLNTSEKFNDELASAADKDDVVVMYAMWGPITYELWYNNNGNDQQQYVKIPVKYDEKAMIEHLNRTGFDFCGWTSADSSATTSKYSTTGEDESWSIWSNPNSPANASYFKNLATTQSAVVHLVATYTPILYYVQYDANGGTGEVPTDVATYNVGDNFTLASYDSLIGTKGDKVVIGWSTDPDDTSAITATTFDEKLALKADDTNKVTFYAVWINNTFTVKVDIGNARPSHIPSGWELLEGTGYYIKQVESGSSTEEIMSEWGDVEFELKGYVFSSWNYPVSIVISDIVVTANFLKECVVSVDTEGIAPKSVSSEWILQENTGYYVRTIIEGSSLDDIDIVLSKVPSAQYTYTHSGWKYNDGTPASFPVTITDNTTFYALYAEELREYTVTFNNDDDTEIRSELMEYGTVIIPPKSPEKASDTQCTYKFLKWEGYTEGMKVSKDTSFTAVYEKTLIVPEKKDVSYDFKDTSSVNINSDDIAGLKEKAKNEDVTVRFEMSDGSVIFDKDAILSFKEAGDLKISKVDEKSISEDIKKIVGYAPIYEFDFGANKNFGNGKATMTLPYSLKTGDDPDHIKIYYLKDGNIAEKIDCRYNDGKITFDLNHFSTYAVVYESSTEDNSNTSNIWIIVGVVIGVIAVIAIIAIVIMKKNKTKEEQ